MGFWGQYAYLADTRFCINRYTDPRIPSVFDDAERGPDEDLRLQFEAVSRMSDDDKKVIKARLMA